MDLNDQMPTVTLANQQRFSAETGTSILEAARAQGITLEYSCRTGRCGVCRAPVLSGETNVLRHEESLTPADHAAGIILTCCRSATSDLSLDIEDLGRLADVKTKTQPCRIASIVRPASDVIVVKLRLPPNADFAFLPGQFIDIIAKGVRRSYSIANAPQPDGQLELHIKRVKGGVLSEFWFEKAKVGDLLRFEGPLGTFFLRDTNPTNIIFLATGTGIAPIKAIIEELAKNPELVENRTLVVYWGNRHAESFYWKPQFANLPVRMELLLSMPDTSWTGRRGRVQQALIEDGLDLTDAVVYACGSDAMIHDAQVLLTTHGLSRRRFFSDAFVSSN